MAFYKNLLSLLLCFCCIQTAVAFQDSTIVADSTPLSSKRQAITLLQKIQSLPPSSIWPNVDAALFLENLRLNVTQPLHFYEGRSTNFCSYSALSYLLINDNPLGYVKTMLQLYKEGKANYRNVKFEPTLPIKKAVGTLKYKGVLDIRPADQMWFLCLANHFKGYLNLFDHHYDEGNEDTFWAACNYAKFNRMLKQLLNYHVEAVGSDLIRPNVKNLYAYLNTRLLKGTLILYLNNRFLRKTAHPLINIEIPTHFVIVKSIVKNGDDVTFTYWDYGNNTVQQLPMKFLRRIIFGISYCTKK